MISAAPSIGTDIESLELPKIPAGLKINEVLLKDVSKNIAAIGKEVNEYLTRVNEFVQSIVSNKKISKSDLKNSFAPQFKESLNQAEETIKKIVKAVNSSIFSNLLEMSHFEAVSIGQLFGVLGGRHGIAYRLKEAEEGVKVGKKLFESSQKSQVQVNETQMETTHLEQSTAILERCVSLKERILAANKELEQVFIVSKLDSEKVDVAFVGNLNLNPDVLADRNKQANLQYNLFHKQLLEIQESTRAHLSNDKNQIQILQEEINKITESMEISKLAKMNVKKEEEEQIAILEYHIASIKATSEQTNLRLDDVIKLLNQFKKAYSCTEDSALIKAVKKDSLLTLQDKVVKLKERIKVRNNINTSLNSSQKFLLVNRIANFYEKKAEELQSLKTSMEAFTYKGVHKNLSIEGQVLDLNDATRPLVESSKKLQSSLETIESCWQSFEKTYTSSFWSLIPGLADSRAE